MLSPLFNILYIDPRALTETRVLGNSMRYASVQYFLHCLTVS